MGGGPLIVLDTHAWFWWMNEPRRLSAEARRAVERSSRIGIAAISLWELAGLIERQRIRVPRSAQEWIESALSIPGVELLPITPAIAATAARIGGAIPGDPADRLIAATALEMKAPLVTRDERLHGLPHLEVIW
ncbi:MAG: type II toxin-antitoxin system VapC family toxin [Candidatus Coatesbacteria bacterium]